MLRSFAITVYKIENLYTDKKMTEADLPAEFPSHPSRRYFTTEQLAFLKDFIVCSVNGKKTFSTEIMGLARYPHLKEDVITYCNNITDLVFRLKALKGSIGDSLLFDFFFRVPRGEYYGRNGQGTLKQMNQLIEVTEIELSHQFIVQHPETPALIQLALEKKESTLSIASYITSTFLGNSSNIIANNSSNVKHNAPRDLIDPSLCEL